jgi:hypothetical protein
MSMNPVNVNVPVNVPGLTMFRSRVCARVRVRILLLMHHALSVIGER